MDEILDKVEGWEEGMYTDGFFAKEKWDEKKGEFIAEWKERDGADYYGYYLFGDRVGLLFDYYRMGWERVAFEFVGMAGVE